MPHNNKRSKSGTKPPQRYVSKALRYILLHSVAVSEKLADVPDISTSSPKLTQEELVSLSIPKPDCSFQSWSFRSSYSSALEFLEMLKLISGESVYRSSHNVLYLIDKEFSEKFILVFFHVARQFIATSPLLLEGSLKIFLKFLGLLVLPHALC